MYPKRQEHFTNPWILAGAATLAGIAGFTNSASLALTQLSVSHLTGSFSRVSLELAQRELSSVVPFLAILGSFFAGTIASGSVVGDNELGTGRRYAVMLSIEGALLACAALLAGTVPGLLSASLAAAACGLQNALASSFHGMVVRTTHMTGIVTDLGFQVGKLLVRKRVDHRHFALQITLLVAFMIGGIAGALTEMRYGPRALYLAAAGALCAALAFWQLRARDAL